MIFKQCGTFTQIKPNDQFTWLRRSRDRIWDVDVVFNLILRDLLMQPILILNEICRFSNFLKSGLRKSRNHRKRKGTEKNNSKSREIFFWTKMRLLEKCGIWQVMWKSIKQLHKKKSTVFWAKNQGTSIFLDSNGSFVVSLVPRFPCTH